MNNLNKNIPEEDTIINVMCELTSGSNIEIYDCQEYVMGVYRGLRFDLFDHLNKVTDFESDIKSLLMELRQQLGQDFIFSYNYSPEMEICDIDGELYPDYHCYLKIYKSIPMEV